MAKDKSWVRRLATHLADRVKDIPNEVYEHLTDRTLPQGAAELSHALYTGSGYVPYGPGQRAAEGEQSQNVPAPQTRAEEQPQQQEDQAKTRDHGLEM
jgi:hypothetical protein